MAGEGDYKQKMGSLLGLPAADGEGMEGGGDAGGDPFGDAVGEFMDAVHSKDLEGAKMALKAAIMACDDSGPDEAAAPDMGAPAQ